MDTIAKSHREITKDYGNSVIKNVWVDSSEHKQKLSIESTRAIKGSMLEALQIAQDSIICLYTSFLDPEILRLVSKIADNNRIYIYTKNRNTLQEISHHSLVRVGENLAGSFVLIQKDKNIQGFFSTKDFDIESNQLFLELDSNQCNDFWHYFITCFWKGAKKEYIAGQEKEIKEINQKDFISPFQNGFDIEFITDSISQRKSNALIQLQENSPLIDLLQDFKACNFLLRDSKILSDEILKNSTTSNFVITNIGFDSIDTDIFLSDNNALLYRLSLNDTQNTIFKKLRESIVITKTFKHEVALNELIDKTLHYLDGTTAKVEQSITHTDSIQCEKFLDKDELERQDLDYTQIWQDKYPHICRVSYSFDVIPFYTPAHFTKANLYNEWDNTHKALHNAINEALKDIEKTQEKQKELEGFGALLEGVKKSFKQFFLGKNTNLKDIATKLNEIKDKATLETLNIDSTQSYIKDLQEYANTISENSGEINSKLDEAQEHNKWQRRKNKLEEEIKKLQQDCEAKRKELINKEKEYKAKEANLDSMQEDIQNLHKGRDDLQNELNISQDSKDKNTDIESKLNQIKQTLNSRNNAYDKEKKNKEALDKHIKTEKEKLQKDEDKLKSLNNDLETKYEKFHYNKKDSKESESPLAFMDKNNEKQSTTKREINIPIPKEDCPNTGVLKENKEDKNERLLEISLWSEVEMAKQETQRLKAKLSIRQQDSSQQKG